MGFFNWVPNTLLLTLICPTLCGANIYVTQPTTQTQWVAGRSVQITWEDDGHHPLLKSLGKPVTVSLYPSNKGLYPDPLAVWHNVDARSQLLDVKLKSTIGSALPNTFFLQFKHPKSHLKDDVYSARFSILPIEHTEKPTGAYLPTAKQVQRIQSPNDTAPRNTSDSSSGFTSSSTAGESALHSASKSSGPPNLLIVLSFSIASAFVIILRIMAF